MKDHRGILFKIITEKNHGLIFCPQDVRVDPGGAGEIAFDPGLACNFLWMSDAADHLGENLSVWLEESCVGLGGNVDAKPFAMFMRGHRWHPILKASHHIRPVRWCDHISVHPTIE